MNEKINYLKSCGVDTDTAIENMIDFDTYYEILQEFYKTIDSVKTELQSYKDQNDMPNYAICVHALKSNVRSLGFMDLGELAYSHELKSKEGDSNFIISDFDHLMTEIDKVKEQMTNCINL